jgi:hypothetical protein
MSVPTPPEPNATKRAAEKQAAEKQAAEKQAAEKRAAEERAAREQAAKRLTLLTTIDKMGGKIRSEAESNWHFAIEAPSWAVRSPRGNATTSAVAGGAALLLAGSAFWLAWHAVNKLTGSQSALAVQIGPWAAVGALLVGAGVAAYAATGSRRLQLRMTQLADGETAAKALAASASGQAQADGSAGVGAAAPGNIEIAAAHAAAADLHAAAAAGAAGAAPDAAPAVASAESSAAAAHASVAGAAVGGGSGSVGGTSSAKDPATTISPKVWAGSIAGAVSFSFWTIAAATFWKSTFSSDALAALVGSTTTIVSAAAAYWRTDPLRVKPGTSQANP